MKNLENCEKWYDVNFSLYNSCGKTLKNLIEKILIKNAIPFHSIEYRVKTKNSFIEKCKKEKYDDPVSEITDVCGLRIIGYTNHDVRLIQNVIESEFKIDEKNSVDKSKIMKTDQVGYRSIHYVASIKSDRSRLVEYQEYKDLKFEIQIRTLLQHAWAEIEHDRNYKFSGELPSEIKRRFYLVAGSLELLDREFDQISHDIDTYAKDIREETQKGIFNESINSTSLNEYLSVKFNDYSIKHKDFHGRDKEIISELFLFGIETLKDLDIILTPKFIEKVKDENGHKNFTSLLRDIMIINDHKKYFEKAWQHHWTAMQRERYDWLLSRLPEIKNYRQLFEVINHN